jgi:hypothetical protein
MDSALFLLSFSLSAYGNQGDTPGADELAWFCMLASGALFWVSLFV